ncbi:MAG: phosphoenolpyruvate carboxylase [Bacteroidales bacterium]|nr:phosphoenolpyruvate carboxylase [Bacteroidales bacterium]
MQDEKRRIRKESPDVVKVFEKTVKKKFNLYNSLFLNLPYGQMESIGTLIPILQQECKKGLDAGKNPQQILDAFFENQTGIRTEKEKIDFMFRVIQYVERQVVLFDSVEDAALPHIREMEQELSIRDFVRQLDHQNSLASVIDKLSDFSARIVFTAHPTQFYPISVLDIIRKLRALVMEDKIEQIDITLQQLGLTSLLNPDKPTPLDEARNIIYFLRNVYYEAVPEFYNDIKKTLNYPAFDNPGIIKMGFWPGGDRDGNPFVTAETTLAVADELRISLMKSYYADVKNLEFKLTFNGVEKHLMRLKDKIYKAMYDASVCPSFEEIFKPLKSVRKIVSENYNSLYIDEIDLLIDKVKIFKTHFATLDIRQNHNVHFNTVQEILRHEKIIDKSLDELTGEELTAILLHGDFWVNADNFDDPLTRDTILNIGQIKRIQDKNGEEGCNRYIISHSEDKFAVLFVFALLRWCGWQNGKIPMDIVPLFESVRGMENSTAIMEELYRLPEYRDHVDQRGNRQTMMLGFSDGTKDGGYLMANWSIFTTKENLSELSDRYRIRAIFFDGRGGPPARGGGKTHRFYAAQSEKIASHEIQLTIQGQTISSKYGTKEHFIYNCEQLVTANLYNRFFKIGIDEDSRKLIDRLAQISYDKYTELKNHEKFIPYLENRSTLRFYGATNIGSRPAKRGNFKKLKLSDLRAIPYVGSWSQLKQNVPGYFGIGTALEVFINEGKEEELKNLFNRVPFFKALLLNSMMSLSKCYFELTSYLSEDDEYGTFWKILFNEYHLSKELLLRISGYSILMEEEPVSRNSVRIREKIVLPLLVVQQYALQKIEQHSEFREIYEKIVIRSLYGNINASRNSA